MDADGVLLLRPATGGQYFVDGAAALSDDRGWINTGDLVRREGDRYLFLGRANGAINVGGNKVFPEEVERVICQVEGVALALVKARRSSITGALVEAVVVPDASVTDRKALARTVQAHCRAHLPAFKAPAIVTSATTLEMAAHGQNHEERAMNGKNVLVTGATRGLGLAVATRLAREGYRVHRRGAEAVTPELEQAMAASRRPHRLSPSRSGGSRRAPRLRQRDRQGARAAVRPGEQCGRGARRRAGHHARDRKSRR